MASRIGVFATSVGTKILIGLSGLFLVFYLLVHIGGNLVVFAGPAASTHSAFARGRNKGGVDPLDLLPLHGFLPHSKTPVRMFPDNHEPGPAVYASNIRAGRQSRKTLASTTM